MSKLIVLSSGNTSDLMKEAENYNIDQLGSLTVSNGHYFLVILGELKVTKEEPKVTKKASATKTPS